MRNRRRRRSTAENRAPMDVPVTAVDRTESDDDLPSVDAPPIVLESVIPPITDRRIQVVSVVARNLVGIVGALFLGWSAADLVFLYFIDTLAGMWSIFAALIVEFSNNEKAATGFHRAYNHVAGQAAAIFLMLFMAFPLGVPLVFVLAPLRWSLNDVFSNQLFVGALAAIVVVAVAWAVRYYYILQTGARGEASLKLQFGILMTRWLLMILVVYWIASWTGPLGPYLLIIVYAISTIASELYPERFVNIFEKGKRGTSRETTDS